MRQLLVLLAASAFTGCASTALTEPVVHASPYLALYRLRGDVGLQSAGGQDNAATSMDTFGQARRRDDVGLRVDVGDGFSGLRADYYKLDMNTSTSGQLAEDWGALLAGDSVSMFASMDELRLGYVEELVEFQTKWRAEDLRVRLGAGGASRSTSTTRWRQRRSRSAATSTVCRTILRRASATSSRRAT